MSQMNPKEVFHNTEYSGQLQGVPKNMGIQWRIVYRLCYELAL